MLNGVKHLRLIQETLRYAHIAPTPFEGSDMIIAEYAHAE